MNQQSNQNILPNHNYSNGTDDYSSSTLPVDQPINIKKYVFILISNWFWILLSLGIAIGVAIFKIRYTIPQYQTSAVMIFEEDASSQDVMSEFNAIRYQRRRTDLGNEIAKLKSYSLAKRTVENLQQYIAWTAHGRIRERPLYENNSLELEIINDPLNWHQNIIWFIDIIDEEQYRLYHNGLIDTILDFDKEQVLSGWHFKIKKKPLESGYETYSFIVNDANTLAKQYRNKLQIETNEKVGSIITLRSIGPVGERETDYINEICKTYIRYGLERNQQIADNTIHFIDQQLEVIIDSLQQSEAQLVDFRTSNNVINLSKEGELAYNQLKDFIDKKKELRLKSNYYTYLGKYVEERNNPQTIISPTLLEANDPLLIDEIRNLQQFYLERENLDFSVAENNPRVEQINEQIASTRLRIIGIIEGLKKNNALTLEQIISDEQVVLNQLNELPIIEQQLLNITRKYDLYNQFYTFLLQKRAETGIQKASTISKAHVIDPARYNQIVQVGNNKHQIILVSFLIGLIIPIAVLILLVLLKNRIQEREDVTNRTNIPIFGIIGHSMYDGPLPLTENPNSAFAESLRRIRTNLDFKLRDPKQKIILVTSSVSGEGKTFTASNLATIFAMNNKKVLIIGCDLRRPALHKIFNISNSTGLSSIIIGKTTIEEAINKTSIQNLSLLPSGPVPPNPSELLESNEMKQLFEKLKKKFDYIILDTPPVAMVSETLALASHADSTLFVIRQNYSHTRVITIINQLESEGRLPNIGLLINDIKPSRYMGYSYYYGYSGGYNYGYNYYSNYYTKNSDI